jgi:hypothetical protein
MVEQIYLQLTHLGLFIKHLIVIQICKVAREVVGGPRGPIVIIVEVIQCKVD